VGGFAGGLVEFIAGAIELLGKAEGLPTGVLERTTRALELLIGVAELEPLAGEPELVARVLELLTGVLEV